MNALILMLLLTINVPLSSADSQQCYYKYWRLTVQTVSSSGWETYISEIKLYELGTRISNVYDIMSNVDTKNLKYCFDNNTQSISKFPYSGLPEVGDYIQWTCDPACSIDTIELSQSTGGNNIPQWNIQYSDCGQNFTTKWTATTTSAKSTSVYSPSSATVQQCYYDSGNCTTSSTTESASSTSTMLLSSILAVLGCILVVLILGICYYIHNNKTKSSVQKISPNHDIESLHHVEIINTTDVGGISHPAVTVAPVNEHFQAFLSHDWGPGLVNHTRAKAVFHTLRKLGISSWFDEERMTGNIVAKMAAGIDSSDCMVVFLTRNYIAKVNGNDERDSCKVEFQYAFNRLGPQKMIPVVMESELMDTKKWFGVIGATLGSRLYVDMTGDLDDVEILFSKTKQLHKHILEISSQNTS